jgi:hypothetical protein
VENNKNVYDPADLLGRLPIDMAFFPKRLRSILLSTSVWTYFMDKPVSPNGVVIEAYSDLEDDLAGMSEKEADEALQSAFTKMLDMGTKDLGERIKNRKKPAYCDSNY